LSLWIMLNGLIDLGIWPFLWCGSGFNGKVAMF